MTGPLRLAAFGTIALISALVLATVGDEPPDADEHRQQIAAMTNAERAQLRRKQDDFNHLSPEQRDSIRSIHEAVEDDAALLRTLLEYEKFVSSLDPWDQTELRRLDDDQRLARIEEILGDRRRRNEPRHIGWLAGRIIPGTVYHPREFEAAMQHLAGALDLAEADRQKIEGLPQHERHLEIARSAAKKLRSQRGEATWPPQEVVDELIALMPDGWLKQRIEDNDQSPEDRHSAAIGMVMRSLATEWQLTAATTIPHERLLAELNKLPEKQQAELQRRDPGELLREILQVIARGSGPDSDFARQYQEAVSLRREFDRFGRGRRGPDRGPGDRGPGDRRPGGDRDRGPAPPGPPRDRRPGDPRREERPLGAIWPFQDSAVIGPAIAAGGMTGYDVVVEGAAGNVV